MIYNVFVSYMCISILAHKAVVLLSFKLYGIQVFNHNLIINLWL